MKKLTTERFGLVLIFAALVVIGLITSLLIADRHASRKQAVLVDGANLARLLSKLPYPQLVLALAKDIIDLHHGSIAVDSVLGEGTTFSIELKKTATILKKVI